MRKTIALSVLALCVSCGFAEGPAPLAEVAGEARATGVTTDVVVRPRARPSELVAAARDVLSPSPVEEAVAPPAPVATGLLGTTVASLGNATEPGLWLKTPLVDRVQPGRVRYGETGKSVDVQLIPLDGPATAGSQLSLAAMLELGASPADLPTVEVRSGA